MKRTHLFITIAFLIFALAGSAEAQQQPSQRESQQKTQRAKSKAPPLVEYLTSNPNSSFPLSEAVRVGNMLYLSGKVGTDSSGKIVSGGIAAETKQVMESIRSTLERYGSSLDNVVKCTVMLADIQEWAAMNTVYMTYFKKGRFPARSALGASGLALGARVEIECMAVVK